MRNTLVTLSAVSENEHVVSLIFGQFPRKPLDILKI